MSKKSKEERKNHFREGDYFYLVGYIDEDTKAPQLEGYCYGIEETKAYMRDRPGSTCAKIPKEELIQNNTQYLEPAYFIRDEDSGELIGMTFGEEEMYSIMISNYHYDLISQIDDIIQTVPVIKFTQEELSNMRELFLWLKDFKFTLEDGNEDLFSERLFDIVKTQKYFIRMHITGESRKKFIKRELDLIRRGDGGKKLKYRVR